MWAVEHSKVTPDIMCIAKTIGGGVPLSVVAYRSDLVKELPRGFHLGTYRANTLALAVGAETVKVLKEGNLVDRARVRGEKLIKQFHALSDRHLPIGDVRGKGFMVGVEFVRDRASRLPWGDRAKAMRSALLARGVLMHTSGAWDQTLRFMAPLVIEDELLDRGLSAFEDALMSLESTPERAPPSPPANVPTSPSAHPHMMPEHPVPAPATPDYIPGRTQDDEEPSRRSRATAPRS